MTGKELLRKYKKPENFFNRDLSWVDFNRRVLEEAVNPDLPLLDKVKFVSIFSSNLDEFYMIRISGIKDQIAANVSTPTIDGLTPRQELQKIEHVLRPLLHQLIELWTDELIPELRNNGISILKYKELTKNEKQQLDDYFKKEIYPVLTPLASDPGRPFPYISNLSLSLAVSLSDPKGENHFARVKVPSILPRLLRVGRITNPETKSSSNGYKEKFIWLEDLIKANLDLLFPKMEIYSASSFRITRDTDIEIQEDEADDLLLVIEKHIRQRRFGNVVRLEVEEDTEEDMVEMLAENLEISLEDVQRFPGPLGLSAVMQLYGLPLHQLKEKPHYPVIPSIFEEEEDIFSTLKKRDILLHHPYNSFTPVIDFIKQASMDPDVLAIKQTLYRVGTNSPIVKALIEAAELKKQVAVLVELKARFDEENNIFWARELEKAGVHVVYGLVGLKTHAKMSLVVRREFDQVKRYVHVGTGNYNATTAKLYTDIGMFTTDEAICSDVSDLFNYLTGYSNQTDYRKLLVAPINLREKMLRLILREAENKKNGGEGKMILKFNSLVDPTLIAALYEASQAGVQIDLIVRGICCLVPGLKGVSENIRVTSIVGRFLEHTRIFYFRNNDDEEIYIGSADLMQRNLDRRVEAVIPVQNPDLIKYLKDVVLHIHIHDNRKARILAPDMTYSFVNPDDDNYINSQQWLMQYHSKVKSQKIASR